MADKTKPQEEKTPKSHKAPQPKGSALVTAEMERDLADWQAFAVSIGFTYLSTEFAAEASTAVYVRNSVGEVKRYDREDRRLIELHRPTRKQNEAAA